MTSEANFKFGSLYQFGVDFMEGFNSDADTFLSAYNANKNEIYANGYSEVWNTWKEENQDLIIRLYNDLSNSNLIPNSGV